MMSHTSATPPKIKTKNIFTTILPSGRRVALAGALLFYRGWNNKLLKNY